MGLWEGEKKTRAEKKVVVKGLEVNVTLLCGSPRDR